MLASPLPRLYDGWADEAHTALNYLDMEQFVGQELPFVEDQNVNNDYAGAWVKINGEYHSVKIEIYFVKNAGETTAEMLERMNLPEENMLSFGA